MNACVFVNIIQNEMHMEYIPSFQRPHFIKIQQAYTIINIYVFVKNNSEGDGDAVDILSKTTTPLGGNRPILSYTSVYL